MWWIQGQWPNLLGSLSNVQSTIPYSLYGVQFVPELKSFKCAIWQSELLKIAGVSSTFKVFPASGPAGMLASLSYFHSTPQRCSSRWDSECPLSMLSLNLHSFLVWNICEFEEWTDGTEACQIQPFFPNYIPPLVSRSHGPWMSIKQLGRTEVMSSLKTKASYLTLLIPPVN